MGSASQGRSSPPTPRNIRSRNESTDWFGCERFRRGVCLPFQQREGFLHCIRHVPSLQFEIRQCTASFARYWPPRPLRRYPSLSERRSLSRRRCCVVPLQRSFVRLISTTSILCGANVWVVPHLEDRSGPRIRCAPRPRPQMGVP